MNNLITTACASLVMTCVIADTAHAQRQLVGNLMCTAEVKEAGASVRAMECRMRGVEGPPARYTGSIRRLRDVPKPNEKLVFNWSVLSNSGKADRAALEGRYVQRPSEENSSKAINLVGGKEQSILLQPLDDFGGAISVLELELTATKV